MLRYEFNMVRLVCQGFSFARARAFPARAFIWTLYHFWTCPLCRWHWRALWHDLSLEELRYVARTFDW